MEKIAKKSLELHKKYQGKLEIVSKVPLNTLRDLSMAYTPGVAEACRIIALNPKLAKQYTIKSNAVAVVTDGSAVLGLGNIGPLAASPVMEGKAILLKKFANVDAFPICLDTQDSQKIIETIKIIAPVFGAIQLEDIAAPRCFEIEKKLQSELSIPVLHDDQHSTAVVVLAALINALKCHSSGLGHAGQGPALHGKQAAGLPYNRNIMRCKIIINGAGAAGIGIARLLIEYGFKNIIILDSKGAIYRGRPSLDKEKISIAQKTNRALFKGGLAECLKGADVFIGVSKAGLLKPEMIKSMAKNPIIFALANPTPEIMPADARRSGAFIVATGRSDFPNQINNVLAFPGIFRGALDNNVRFITPAMLIKAAKNLAALVKKPSASKILPSLFDKAVVKAVAKAIK